MRGSILFLLLILTSGDPAWGGNKSAHLTHLGALIQSSLPTLTQRGLLPNSLNPEKASIMLDRIHSLNLKTKPAVITPNMAPKVIQSVNSVLQDLSPEKLKSMPIEQLDGIAGIIFDQVYPNGSDVSAKSFEGVTVLSQAKTEKILSLRGKPLQEHAPYRHFKDIQTLPMHIQGIPEEVQPIPKPKNPLRHYTTQETLRKILASKTLRNGNLPYIQIIQWVWRKHFNDLTGIFLTFPHVKGKEVGVTNSAGYHAYADIHFPSELPLLQIEPDRILLIPLPARTPDWFRQLYTDWIESKKISAHHHDEVLKLHQGYGPGPNLSVPIEIVGHGTVR